MARYLSRVDSYFVLILTSEIFWFDLRTIYRDVPILSMLNIAWAALMVPFQLRLLWKCGWEAAKTLWGGVFAVLLVTGFVGVVLTLLSGGQFFFVHALGDVYKLTLFMTGFAFVLYVAKSNQLDRFWRTLIACCFLWSIARVLVHVPLVHFLTAYQRVSFGGPYDIFLLSTALLSMIFFHELRAKILSGVAIVAILWGDKTALVLSAVLFCVGGAIYIARDWIKGVLKDRALVLSVVSLIFVVSALSNYAYENVLAALESEKPADICGPRPEESTGFLDLLHEHLNDEKAKESPIAGVYPGKRLAEILAVVAQMKSASLLTVLFGQGHGAVIPEVTYCHPPWGVVSTDLHSIHATPAALLFRYGLIGIGVYLWICVWLLKAVVRSLSGRIDGRIMVLAGGGILSTSLAIYGVVDDVFLGIAVGYLSLSQPRDNRVVSSERDSEDLADRRLLLDMRRYMRYARKERSREKRAPNGPVAGSKNQRSTGHQ